MCFRARVGGVGQWVLPGWAGGRRGVLGAADGALRRAANVRMWFSRAKAIRPTGRLASARVMRFGSTVSGGGAPLPPYRGGPAGHGRRLRGRRRGQV